MDLADQSQPIRPDEGFDEYALETFSRTACRISMGS